MIAPPKAFANDLATTEDMTVPTSYLKWELRTKKNRRTLDTSRAHRDDIGISMVLIRSSGRSLGNQALPEAMIANVGTGCNHLAKNWLSTPRL